MKLMFTTPGMKFGGAERVISILSNEWSKLGHSVTILITGEDSECVYPLSSGVKLQCIGGLDVQKKTKHLDFLKKIRNAIRQMNPDVVISFMNDVCACTAVAMTGLHIPLFYSERNDPARVNQGCKDKLFRKIVEHVARGVVFQTKEAQQCYSRRVQEKSIVILNPLDLSAIPRCDYGNCRAEIVSVGRLTEQKNQKILIEAFSAIAPRFPEYCLKLYGEGPFRKQLEDLIRGKELQNKVYLMGTSKQVISEIKHASLFVLTSDYEGIPNTLIEAMCIGLPCISTDFAPCGAKILIHNGENGLITPCGDIHALSCAMEKMLSDRETAVLFGKRAKETEKLVDSREISEEWLAFIEHPENVEGRIL